MKTLALIALNPRNPEVVADDVLQAALKRHHNPDPLRDAVRQALTWIRMGHPKAAQAACMFAMRNHLHRMNEASWFKLERSAEWLAQGCVKQAVEILEKSC